MSRQPRGIPRIPPQTSANGITSTQAMMPACNTQTFRTGSRKGPMKNTARMI